MHGSKIPDGTDTAGNQRIADLLGAFLRHRDNAHMNIIVFAELLQPADGIDGVKEAILTAVRDAGPNACPPMVVGVGIGGTFDKCALLAKKAENSKF